MRLLKQVPGTAAAVVVAVGEAAVAVGEAAVADVALHFLPS